MRLIRVLATAVLLAAVPRLAAAQSAPQARSAQKANAADVAFMRGMIHHHAQAIEMAALIAPRTTTPAMQLLGERITVSQRDEIRLMRTWLTAHGETAPDPMAAHTAADHAAHADAGHDMSAMHHDMAGMTGMSTSSDSSMAMPGMLTPTQMAALAAAKGAQFERLFLEGMIRHHEGAIAMVAALFGSQGAAQDADVFRFASDVDADQRAEIARMQALLAKLPQ